MQLHRIVTVASRVSFMGQPYFHFALDRHFNVITDVNKWRLLPRIARHYCVNDSLFRPSAYLPLSARLRISAYLCQSTYHRRDHPPSELNRPTRAIVKFSNVHAVRSDVPVELKPVEVRTLLSKRQLQFTIRRLTDLAASVGPTEMKYDGRKSAGHRASTKSR